VVEDDSLTAIEVDGRRLAWRTAGQGPPLLLVNGYAATGADWDPTFLALLAERHRVICPDNRGIGGSGLGEEELTIDAMAADLEALLDALEIERAPVVAWSMGGFVAQRLAVRAPGRVSALALISTDPGGSGAAQARPEDWARLVDHSGSFREQATRLIALLFPAGLAPEIDRQFGDLVAAARAEMSPATLAAQEAAIEAWHRRDVSGEGGGEAPPTLVAHGCEDVVIPPANAELLAARWPGARVELVEGAAHAVMAQEPRRVAAAIAELLGK
jgi:pimeloyl-ACP methyl ester carboxylesterase